jgi:hypothetical protein
VPELHLRDEAERRRLSGVVACSLAGRQPRLRGDPAVEIAAASLLRPQVGAPCLCGQEQQALDRGRQDFVDGGIGLLAASRLEERWDRLQADRETLRLLAGEDVACPPQEIACRGKIA